VTPSGPRPEVVADLPILGGLILIYCRNWSRKMKERIYRLKPDYHIDLSDKSYAPNTRGKCPYCKTIVRFDYPAEPSINSKIGEFKDAPVPQKPFEPFKPILTCSYCARFRTDDCTMENPNLILPSATYAQEGHCFVPNKDMEWVK
jgi:hypothetical protein